MTKLDYSVPGLSATGVHKSGNHAKRSSGGEKQKKALVRRTTQNVEYALVLAEAKWRQSMQTIFFEELEARKKGKREWRGN